MKYKLLFTIVLVTAMSLFAYPVLAFSPAQEIGTINVLQTIIDVGAVLATLTGVSSLISVVVNILKYFKLIPEGTGGRVFAALNLLAFIVLAGTRIFAPQYSLDFLDGIAGHIATVGLFITGYMFQLGTGQAAYEIIKKFDVPILSHSESRNSFQG